ncbi:hypothetical protein [Nostoc sp. FACHB-110]|uniref:hypothetical protein n=1 Tax=Nostoc sp. FACHB-110 TaxID=2692834 RepID=UPI0016822B35|nr:hypothetical protein [Nostoc sp. FACHB-110]MBD2435863.1 hypothetical protein [Nostoc sp. FACHB-110]
MRQSLAVFNIKYDYFFSYYFTFFVSILIVGYCLPIVASEQQPNPGENLELLQTHLTQNDIKIIERLVTIAERNSSEVLDAKSATGWRAFQDVVSIELSPSLTTTNYNALEHTSEERENSLYLSITLDPIKLISAFEQKPIFQARLNEAKQQKRLTVIRQYLAYIQARQAVQIAAYRMQNFTNNEQIASLNAQTPEKLQSLANVEYVAAATEMLNSNAREQIALEELAACVGLSTSAMMNIMNNN